MFRIFVLLFLLILSTGAAAAEEPTTDIVRLPGHVLPALHGATPITSESASNDPMTLSLVLKREKQADFEVYLRGIYNPLSPRYRKFLSPAEISDRFGPSPEAYDAVRAYFEEHGFAIVEGSVNRMTLTVAGTRATIQKALDIRINDYTIDGRPFYANDREPRLPSKIAEHVGAVIGLSNLAKPRPAIAGIEFSFINAFCTLTGFFAGLGGVPSLQFDPFFLKEKAKCLSSASWWIGAGALGAPDPPPPAWQSVDGTGQKVGIVAFDTFDMSDVVDYIALTGLPANKINNVSQVHVNGGASPGPDQSEVLLDIAIVMATASGAEITVYDAPFTGAGTFQAVFNAMIDDGVTVISNSWAYCEDQTTLADVQGIDNILQTAAAAGISVFSGSGDHGSTCLNGSPNTAHVPATSPHITAVGGTSLTLGPGFTYQSETWWDGINDSPPTGQGGYGVSRFFPRPAYQDGLTSSSMRSIPDVAANADPKQGVMICQASAGGCPSGLFYGGTSAAAPAWAAYAAVLNQAQGSNIGFFNPMIYPLANTDAFHSAGTMGTDFAHVGLGSPNLAKLHQRLTAQTTGPTDPSVSEVEAFSEGDFSFPSNSGTALPVPADGVTRSYVVVRLADALGNLVDGHTVTLSANGGSAAITPASGISAVDNGAVIFEVTNLTAETLTFTATDVTEGIVLDQQPIIEFVTPSAATGGITASPTNVLNNGTDTATITVTLEDALGRPTPGKLITLSQGSGRSVVSGPTPSVTDANGQIDFTVTNLFSETVDYTAVDVTDGNLPIPGMATVTFGGVAELSCVGDPPTAAPGYTLTRFANGFVAQNFFFGGVNFGCAGASNPAFDTSGSVFVSNFRTGDLFKFGADGGVVSSGNSLANLGLTLGQPVFGKDGRLYATRSVTTGGATTGDIVEIDPETGTILRVVAANLTCPFGLATDPLSGDLFFDNFCTGSGLDNPSLFRVRNPASASPTVEVYATLPPDAPNGAISIARDGTIFVVTDYFGNLNAPIVRVDGTDKPSPPAVEILSDITSIFWVTVGETLPDGSPKSLIVLTEDPNAPGPGLSLGLRLVDLTTDPVSSTPLTIGGISSGVIGPDGCLYATATDTIFKLAPETGECGFAATNPSPALALSPTTVSPDPVQGGSKIFEATLRNVPEPEGTPVFFQVTGTNAQFELVRADAGGRAEFEYTGKFVGSDTLIAGADVDGTALISNAVNVNWSAGQHVTFLSLNLSPTGGTVDMPVTVIASLTDTSAQPPTSIEGELINFELGGSSCGALSDQNGIASCELTPLLEGPDSLTATFDGSDGFRPSADLVGFDVLARVDDLPDCSVEGVAATPAMLWPPNHKMKEVSVMVSVPDQCETAPACHISTVTSNEPINGAGDGNTAPDWEITGTLTVDLRRERAGNGNGRVYTITVSCAEVGSSTTHTASVIVPHDQGKKGKRNHRRR